MGQISENTLIRLQNLRMLLKEKEFNDMRYVKIGLSADDVIKKIEKTLSKTPSKYHEEILERATSFAKAKIDRNSLNCNEIFNALPTYVEDVKRNLSNDKYNVPETEEINYDYDTKDVIDKFLTILKDYNRYELISYEENCNNLLKEKTSIYGQQKASGEIIGSLNRGMYEQTREEFINELRENGIKLSSNTRFINAMSSELIKYRIVGLYIASRYCDKIEKRWEENATDSTSKVTLSDYNEARVKTEALGKILKDVYFEKYNITPKNEIKNNIFGGDQIMMDFMNKNDNDKDSNNNNNNKSPKR